MKNRLKKPLLAMIIIVICPIASALASDQNVPPSLKKWLSNYEGADRGVITYLTNESLSKLFPEHSFFSFYFRQFPVARETPEPFAAANILVQSENGFVKHFASDIELLSFFQSNLRRNDVRHFKTITSAWLILSSQFVQDGFYQFSEPRGIEVDDGYTKTKGYIELINGGKGKIIAELEFSINGELLDATTKAEINSGIRPICQATKLLDPDPIVREMAEKDILVMGKNAKPYLDEQRAVSSPDLQREIDRVWNRIINEGW